MNKKYKILVITLILMPLVVLLVATLGLSYVGFRHGMMIPGICFGAMGLLAIVIFYNLYKDVKDFFRDDRD